MVEYTGDAPATSAATKSLSMSDDTDITVKRPPPLPKRMAVDGEHPDHDDGGEILPDEAAVIAERVDDLDKLDDDEYLSTDDVAESLGIDLDDVDDE